MKKISICMAYYNRLDQTLNTLRSISKHTIPFEIIIVDDASEVPLDITQLSEVSHLPIKIINVNKDNKWWANPCIPYNMAFKEATGDIIIIQNPECYHKTDIVKYTNNNLSMNEYISFSCYSLPNGANPETHTLSNKRMSGEGTDGWYNHSKYKPTYYHFTSAIHKSDLDLVGGFDEDFALGIAFDDDALIYHLNKKGIKMTLCDEMVTLHQYHYHNLNNERNDPTFWDKVNRNNQLFTKLKTS